MGDPVLEIRALLPHGSHLLLCRCAYNLLLRRERIQLQAELWSLAHEASIKSNTDLQTVCAQQPEPESRDTGYLREKGTAEQYQAESTGEGGRGKASRGFLCGGLEWGW